ncbi:MAG: phosphoglucosamine mutase [Deltaproteobacteria bacterium]|nr:phosphoglucosamine mutase [Deltaproteobacteria bacterium]
MKKLFGTDGVRGRANLYPITPEIALSLGQAVARYFKNGKTTHRIVIGKDTRLSSYMIEFAIAAGVCSMGSDAVLLGPMSTPGVAFITKAMRADAGVMISASHNHFEDNGIKFFDADGFKLGDAVELEMENIAEKQIMESSDRPVGKSIGKAFRVDDATGRYVEFVKRTFPKALTLDGYKIVVDCANGAAYKLAPMILWELGADVIPVAIKPNGVNINHECGALYPEGMAKLVQEHGADFGMALDGDADRVILCDEHKNIVDGDKVIALCAIQMAMEGTLNNSQIVGTIMSNMGVENYLKKKGIGMIRTPVGDRYIIEEMRNRGLKLGGEPSGHIIFSRHTTTGDGLIAALQVLAAMVRSKRKLSDLVSEIPLYPQVSTKITVREKVPIDEIFKLKQAINTLETRLNGRGRSVVRYSGTEPVLRIMIEGEDAALIKKELGVLESVALSCLT